VQQA
jgi:RNA polymerase sigma factor (sigma-70 family)